MINRLLIIALLWLGSLLAYDLDYERVYAHALKFLQGHQWQIVTLASLGALGLVVFSHVLGRAKWFFYVHFVARIFFEFSQFIVYLLSFAAIVFWFDFGANVWADLGYLLAITPFMILIASCVSLWIFDFNYPLRNRIIRNLALPLLSLLVIYGSQYIG